MPEFLKTIIIGLLTAFLLMMFIRFIVDLVRAFMPDWRPSGALVVLFEIVYTVTDPPLKALRRVIPTLQMGRFALDLSFILLVIGVQVLIGIVSGL